MSQNITLEINPRNVIEAMDEERLARFVAEVATAYHTRVARRIGYGHLAVGELTTTMNAMFTSIDKAFMAVKSGEKS